MSSHAELQGNQSISVAGFTHSKQRGAVNLWLKSECLGLLVCGVALVVGVGGLCPEDRFARGGGGPGVVVGKTTLHAQAIHSLALAATNSGACVPVTELAGSSGHHAGTGTRPPTFRMRRHSRGSVATHLSPTP